MNSMQRGVFLLSVAQQKNTDNDLAEEDTK